jgi:hypothetical protein
MEGKTVGHNIERGPPKDQQWAQTLTAATWQWVD